jgi:hypothetical protein
MAFVLRMRWLSATKRRYWSQGGRKSGSTHGNIGCPLRENMAQSASLRQSRSYETIMPENPGISGARECPKCHSDDVTRSRRKLAERLILPIMRAQVHRCRDCKHRFWVGVQWRFVVLGCLSATVAAGFAMAIMFVHETREEQAVQTTTPQVRRYRAPRQQVPKGLPPLSAVPRPKDDPALATPATH